VQFSGGECDGLHGLGVLRQPVADQEQFALGQQRVVA